MGENGLDIEFDREVMTELITLIPPGLDEVMALLKLIELTNDKSFEIVILDTAPTGHLVRMLEMPELARQWFSTFFKLMLKYQGVVNLQKTIERMVEMARGVIKVQASLTASDKTVFIGVTTPEEMVFAETEKLLAAIQRLKISSRWLVANMVIPSNQCSFCSRIRANQQSYLADLCKRFANFQTVHLPLFPHQVSGINDLTRLAGLLFGMAL